MISTGIPVSYRDRIRIGTCSWKYDSWKGLLYDGSKTYRSSDYLSDYARSLNSVEIDQWFWSLFPDSIKLPDLKVVREYAESVPDDFTFTIKAPNALTLTHFYSSSKNPSSSAGKENNHFLDNGLLDTFLEKLEPMGKNLGPIMFQFEYLNKQKMPSKEVFFELFGKFIRSAPQKFQYAVEIRNPNYLSLSFFDFLRAHNLGFVYLEWYYMPPIGQIFERFHPSTSTFSIIRLHGSDRKEIETETGEVWNKIVAPKIDSIQSAVRITRNNAHSKVLTYINVNNHFEGSAPLTIERFLEFFTSDIKETTS